jgi:hypothetical protein
MSAKTIRRAKSPVGRSARLLQLGFEGYFMCRIATDPDPTNEERGVSGYTMALVDEPPLDQVIRLQPDAVTASLRDPGRKMGIRIGVKVKSVLFDGAPYLPGQEALEGAAVSLEGRNEPFDGPTFDSRNNIVGSDDTMAFVVNPFQLVVRAPGLTIRATDYLNPADPEQRIWEIEDPNTYVRRFPTLNSASTEVESILRVFDQFTYFNDRVRWLREEIARLEGQRRKGREDPRLEARIQGLRTRIYQIEFWGNRVFNKLAFQLTYAFRVNGPQAVEDRRNLLRGKADAVHPWPVSFWFGGWDGDLLVGYMQGTLGIPFIPDAR